MAASDDIRKAVEELRQQLPDNPFLVFTLGLTLGTSEHEEIYRQSVLDGPDDKKVDFHYIDWDTGIALFGQAYESAGWDSVDPPANKATDLNGAVSWLLDADLNTITRESTRAAAQQLRDGLESGDINMVEVYYVHNCRHAKNVDDELHTVQASLRNTLDHWAERAGAPISATAKQLALSDVVDLYDARHSSISVTDQLTLHTSSPCGIVSGPNWRAVYTVLPATELVRLLDQHGDALYSANIRGYLGRRRYARNINRQITDTATNSPDHFWVFNNGITLISRRVVVSNSNIECSGLAVVNGAQTLGSLQEASQSGSIDGIQLLARLIESSDQSLIQDVIRYNNTQNPIKPWELRVLDPVQKRIERDFQERVGITYQFRRGAGWRGPEDILSERLGPWLNSFYGDPITSHRNSPELFDNDFKYRKLFNDSSDVRHLLFVYRLGEAAGATKDEYRRLVDKNEASETQATLYSYFRYGAFTHVVLYLCGEVLAEVFGGGVGVKNRFALDTSVEKNRAEAINLLKRIVQFTLAPLPALLTDQDAYQQLRTTEGIDRLARGVRVSVNQLRSVRPEVVEDLKKDLAVL